MILYNDGVVLVWMIEYRHPIPLSILLSGGILSSKDNDYKIIHSSKTVISSSEVD